MNGSTEMDTTKSLEQAFLHSRLGMSILAIIFPFVFIFLSGIGVYDWRYAISAYNHLDGFARNFFVAVMFTVGFMLIRYEGILSPTTIPFKVAGMGAIAAAFFPTDNNGCTVDVVWMGSGGIHLVGCVIFFCAMIYACHKL